VIDDFIREAGIARGTFYNYFTRTEQLLQAVSKSLEDDLMLSIEEAMTDLSDPDLRLATGVRLWLTWARTDPVWCAFIVKSRFRGPFVERRIQMDLKNGRKAGAFLFSRLDAARDLLIGTILEAMARNMTAPLSKAYIEGVAKVILQGLGLQAARIDQLVKMPIPRLMRPVQKVSGEAQPFPR
jgi:AcrR family transcriptional regulator